MDTTRKKDLKFLIVFLIILSFSLLYLFQSSYAKYRKQIEGEVSANIASWRIKINNEDIANKKLLTNAIVPTFLETEHTAKNVIAPGSIGYYTLIIDTSNVDVSFEYSIFSDVSDKSSVTDLKTLSYVMNPDGGTATEISYDSAKGIVGTVDKNTTSFSVKINLQWDDINGSMNNEQDTTAAIYATNKALMDVKLQFSQLNN